MKKKKLKEIKFNYIKFSLIKKNFYYFFNNHLFSPY